MAIGGRAAHVAAGNGVWWWARGGGEEASKGWQVMVGAWNCLAHAAACAFPRHGIPRQNTSFPSSLPTRHVIMALESWT